MKKLVSIIVGGFFTLTMLAAQVQSGPTGKSESLIPLDKSVELKMFWSRPVALPDWKWGNDYISKWISGLSGVKLNIEYATNPNLTELYTMLAAGLDLPDLLYLNKYDPMLVKEKYVLPLNKIADQYKYKEFYDRLPYQYDVLHTLDDGNIYYTATQFGDAKALATLVGGKKGVTGWNVKYPMWEKMGYPTVETLEDVKKVALQAKANGVKYPMFLVTDGVIGQMTYPQVMNVSYGGPGFVYPQANGIVTFNVKAEEYKKGLKYLNECFRLGLIQKENFTLKVDALDEVSKGIANRNEILFIVGQHYRVSQHIKENYWRFNYIPTPTGPGLARKDAIMDEFNSTRAGVPSFYVMANTKRPLEALKFLTTLLRQDVDIALSKGFQGLHYTFDTSLIKEGTRVQTKEYLADQKAMSSLEFASKWGIGSILQSFTNRYQQAWGDRRYYLLADGAAYYVPYLPMAGKTDKEEPGAVTANGDYGINLFADQSRSFKTGIMTVNFTEPDQLELYNNVCEAWLNSLAEIVIANSDAAFETAYKQCIANMEKVGLSKLEALMTPRYTKYAKQLGDTRNAKWDQVILGKK